LAVPLDKIAPMYQSVNTHEDIPSHILNAIEHFFTHYKDLEKGKWVKIEGWDGPEAAKSEILASVKRYNDNPS
jgi:inorganic pyrophosphatase